MKNNKANTMKFGRAACAAALAFSLALAGAPAALATSETSGGGTALAA